EIELVTPPIGEAGPLVIRNASPAGVSRAQCRITKIYPFELEITAAPAPQGYALLDTRPWLIDTTLSKLPDDALLSLATALATLAPPTPVPHWSWNAYEKSPELAVHIRHAVWLTAKHRALEPPVIVPWHAGTHLALHLDNDLSHILFVGGSFEPNEFALLD